MEKEGRNKRRNGGKEKKKNKKKRKSLKKKILKLHTTLPLLLLVDHRSVTKNRLHDPTGQNADEHSDCCIPKCAHDNKSRYPMDSMFNFRVKMDATSTIIQDLE